MQGRLAAKSGSNHPFSILLYQQMDVVVHCWCYVGGVEPMRIIPLERTLPSRIVTSRAVRDPDGNGFCRKSNIYCPTVGATAPIVMVNGIVPLQPKALSPMLVASGKDAVVRDVQSRKALTPMYVASGNDTVVRDVQ
jgi:hypothetical protein